MEQFVLQDGPVAAEAGWDDEDNPAATTRSTAACPTPPHAATHNLEDTVAAGLESAMNPTHVAADAIPAQAPASESPGFSAMVVDDHPLVRESMVNRLKMMGAREVVEAATIGEARARANLSGPRELCVLDLGLPDGSGLDLLADLRSAGWQRLVVLSAADDPYSVRAAFVAGAQGYLLKSASPVVVADGVRRVLDGGVYADPSVASLLAAGLRGGPVETGISELSGREVEVLRLVADGQSNKQIGDALGLSALTVKSHLARIARKLGTGDRAEMVALAMRAGVIR
jgi:DNA-binding NarL/FixJ family response regulator